MNTSHTSPSSSLASIQILRGIAALLVVLWHSDLALELFANDYWRDVPAAARAQLYPFWANHLCIGVDIFFCISGFVMTMLAAKATKHGAWPFLRNRIARIAPPYWFFTVCLLVLYNVSSSFHIWRLTGLLTQDVPATILSFFLLPQANGPILAVGWTLIYEFMFYIFVALVLLFNQGKRLPLYLGGMAIAGAALRLLNIEILHGFVITDYYVEFFMGSLAYALRKHAPQIMPLVQVAIAVVLYFIVSLLLDTYLDPIPYKLINVAGSGLIGFLLLNGLIGLDTKYAFDTQMLGRLGAHLGNASYSLYLSHWFTLSLIGKGASAFTSAPVPFIIGWHIGAVVLTVAVAILFAAYVELPLHKKVLKRFTIAGSKA